MSVPAGRKIDAGLQRELVRAAVLALALFAGAAVAAKELSEDDVTAALMKIIAARSKDGVFPLRDAKTGATLALEFDSIRVVRGLTGFGWFPEAIFREKGASQKKYAVDFWLKPAGDELKLLDARVHKDPQPDGASFMMITRAPLLWWWLPTLERKSAVSGVEAWQLMGTVHEYIAARSQDGTFPFVEPGGKTIPLELIQIDQPVGKSKAGDGYYVCAEFRNLSDPAAFHDIDFRLPATTRSLQVASVQPRKTTANATTGSPQHCRLESDAFETVD